MTDDNDEIEFTKEELEISNRAIVDEPAPEPESEPESEEIENTNKPSELDELMSRDEHITDGSIEEPVAEERKGYSFAKPKRDLIFLPGTGGNFFATQIYDQVLSTMVGLFSYDERINEYTVNQSISHLSVNGKSRSDVVTEIRKIPQRMKIMISYIKDFQMSKGIDKYDWLLVELQNALSVSHRLTQYDIQNIAFSDFLISKNTADFTLEDEKNLMGKDRVGEFYDNLHDLFYQHFEAHFFPYMTDIGHIPYHINTHKPRTRPLHNYGYANIIAHEQGIYTQLLQMVKHALRKKEIEQSDVTEIRNFVRGFLDSKHKTYEYIMTKMHSEMETTGIADVYSRHYYYKDMIIDANEDSWGDFYNFFGYGDHFWTNKTRLMDNVHQYHSKNIELLLNFVTKREIEILMYPFEGMRVK